MPSMNKIIDYWREQRVDWLRSWTIGWGEPFCFACGWLAPVLDGRRDSWKIAGKWLDRAHLHDHYYGGPDEPANLVALCHLCHDEMPESRSRDCGIQWVKDRPFREDYWQLWTDSVLRDRSQVSRSTTLIRARMRYLEYMAGVSTG